MSTESGASSTTIYELEITLLDSDPPIWRRFAVPGGITLSRLHRVVQHVMGWTDSHLHQFVTEDDMRYGSRDPDLDPEPDLLNERSAKLDRLLAGPGDTLLYQYDFGDGWDHVITVVKTGPPDPEKRYPVCLAGERACPPEDSGGIYGYYDLLEALSDRDHEDHEEVTEWLGVDFDPEAFDLAWVNRLLARLK